MSSALLRAIKAAFVGVVIAGAVLFAGGSVAEAQTVFCPTSVTLNNGASSGAVGLIAGNCTNPSTAGAFSGAALGSEQLGSLAQSSANLETSQAVRAIAQRREQLSGACAAGTSLVDGVCKANPLPAPAPAKPNPIKTRAKETSGRKTNGSVTTVQGAGAAEETGSKPSLRKPSTRGKIAAKTRRPAASAPEVSVAAPIGEPSPTIKSQAVDETFRIGVWAEGFGDYEHRSGTEGIGVLCCTTPPAGHPQFPVPATLTAVSGTTNGGFIGGVDAIKRGLSNAQDGLIFGVLSGFTDTRVTVNSANTTLNPVNMASGSAAVTAGLHGPSLGLYLTYFNGPLSNELLVKNDFLTLGENFSEVLGFGQCTCFPLPLTFTTAFSGSASTGLDELTISDNVKYRFPLSEIVWFEPTAGVQFTDSYYSGGAAALGLADGHTLRLQGGGRVGYDWFVGGSRVTTSVTGLAFDDVIVSGNFIQGGVFGTNASILSDQGKLQGEGILAVNVDLGHGLSTFAQGDLRGGSGIYGFGGKAGVRLEW